MATLGPPGGAMSGSRTPWPMRTASWALPLAGAALGHAVGAVAGVVVFAGPAARLSAAMGLALVHVLADLATALGAVWGAAGRPRHPTLVITVVLATGVVASVAVLWPLGTGSTWLLLRAALVIVVATVAAAWQSAAQRQDSPRSRSRRGRSPRAAR